MTNSLPSTALSRRSLLASTAALLIIGTTTARARTLAGGLPWEAGTASPPVVVRPGPWMFFTADEASLVEAAVDRLIPPDSRGPGGRDAGCAVFIDRQLAGPYGRNEGLYNRPPFNKGFKQQGPQSPSTPGELYRTGLAALDDYCRAQHAGKGWVELGQ